MAEDGADDMIKTNSRFWTGLLTGALSCSLMAQEPAAPAQPADERFQAPDNVAAPPADAIKSETGLASLVLKKGTGSKNPKATDTVKVHYTGWQASDGRMFDSSLKRGQPAEFGLNQVISGWTEGVQLMVEGETRRFWIPGDLAYGDTPSRPGGPSGMLVFDVELLEIIKGPEPPETPENLTAPEDAIATASGLKSKILKEGEGDATPGLNDIVTAHFSGWKADGEFLTSTKMQGNPSQFQVRELTIEGWKEGLQLMKKGEIRRFWIPAALAFGKEGDAPPGAPTGDLVFDFELLDIQAKPKVPSDPNAPSDVAAPPEGASKTDSGMSYTVLAPGTGEATPDDGSLLKVIFTVWDAEGVNLGSSKQMQGPLALSLDDVPVKGWVEILGTMKAGEKRRVWIPQELTAPAIPDRGTLTFDLELVSFKPRPKAPDTPEDVAAPPADAKKMPSGLAYKVLQEGTGTRKPTSTDVVKVHYTGWTTDGEMFDSSIERDQLFEFSLAGGVIEGWLEGVKLMVEGEKTRFWIPVEMAYKNIPDRPAGMLVFDIELVEFVTPPPKKRVEAVTPPIEVTPPKPKEEATEGGEEKAE